MNEKIIKPNDITEFTDNFRKKKLMNQYGQTNQLAQLNLNVLIVDDIGYNIIGLTVTFSFLLFDYENYFIKQKLIIIKNLKQSLLRKIS